MNFLFLNPQGQMSKAKHNINNFYTIYIIFNEQKYF
jgi:hypothetical protein